MSDRTRGAWRTVGDLSVGDTIITNTRQATARVTAITRLGRQNGYQRYKVTADGATYFPLATERTPVLVVVNE